MEVKEENRSFTFSFRVYYTRFCMQKKRKLCTLYEKNVNVRVLWLYEIPKVPEGAGKGLQTGNDYGIFLPTSTHTAEVRGIR